MIRIKAYTGELNEFLKFLNVCIDSDAKTIDTVKEYYLTNALVELSKRIIKKLFTNSMEGIKYPGRLSVKVTQPEMIALSIYFARHEVHAYLKPIENDIVKQIPAELIEILKPLQTLKPQTDDYTDYSDY
jgi:hypothetical protein